MNHKRVFRGCYVWWIKPNGSRWTDIGRIAIQDQCAWGVTSFSVCWISIGQKAPPRYESHQPKLFKAGFYCMGTLCSGWFYHCHPLHLPDHVFCVDHHALLTAINPLLIIFSVIFISEYIYLVRWEFWQDWFTGDRSRPIEPDDMDAERVNFTPITTYDLIPNGWRISSKRSNFSSIFSEVYPSLCIVFTGGMRTTCKGIGPDPMSPVLDSTICTSASWSAMISFQLGSSLPVIWKPINERY